MFVCGFLFDIICCEYLIINLEKAPDLAFQLPLNIRSHKFYTAFELL